jgi:O-antigen/teichoic acid export membrane protein
MIGMYSVGNFENGYYEQSEKIVKVCLTIITSLGTVIAPRIAYVHANNDNDKLKTYISKSYRFVFFLGIPMCVGMIALADMIVPWFLGAGYEKCILLIRIFSPLLVIIGMSNVTGVQYLVPVKKQNILTVSVSIGAIVNLIINMCLIPRFYSIGASIATIIAESVITIMQLIYVSKLDKIINLSSLVKPFLRYLINGAVMLVVVMWVKRYLVATFIDTLVLAIIGAVIYVLLLTVEKDEFVLEGINVARRMFNKIKRYMRTLVI